ncbi:MAG TPA: hypothetical protein H9815_01540 [Candidatus Ruania gallistercoris]|uniref:Antitoxin n=1 Tax=Candidatus Ruania gallistercoris TaxID=2838746 RepID=A0A9D2J311_9MICO|nr:hypothetical protein [Candidatus Ruania gallistercoris]
MSDVLIRNVPAEDLDRIRGAAAAQGVSLQHYLQETVRAQARFLRRRDAIARTETRLRDRPAVPDVDREAVLDAIAAEDAGTAEELADRIAP